MPSTSTCMMVDSYQVLIDNGNNSTSNDSDTPKLSTILRKNMNETSETSLQQQRQHTDTDLSETVNAISVDCGDHCDVRRNNDEIMCGPSSAKHGSDDDQTLIAAKVISTATTTAADSSRVDNEGEGDCIIGGCAPNYSHDPNPFQNGLTDIIGYNNSDKCSAATTKNNCSKLNRNSGSVTTTTTTKAAAATTTTETSTSGGRIFGAYEVCANSNTRNDKETDGDTGTNSKANCVRVIDAVWHVQRASSAALPTTTTNSPNRKEIECSGGATTLKVNHHHHHQLSNNYSCSENSTVDMESRKVEPLRININRVSVFAAHPTPKFRSIWLNLSQMERILRIAHWNKHSIKVDFVIVLRRCSMDLLPAQLRRRPRH